MYATVVIFLPLNLYSTVQIYEILIFPFIANVSYYLLQVISMSLSNAFHVIDLFANKIEKI